jgi:enoyl-CoA hydratase/carnithine racemase
LGSVTESLVEYRAEGRTCFITLNRPHAMNALSIGLRAELAEAVLRYDADDQLRVCIVTGAGGKAFSAGVDLKELAAIGLAHARPVSAAEALSSCRKPTVAAIDGYCLAGGFELAMSCDIRIATTQSTFGLPEVRRSLLPGPGLHQLTRIIPLGEALQMQLTGSPITAERAHQIGLVQQLAADRDQLTEKIDLLASAILKGAPLAVKAAKQVVMVGRNLPIEYSQKYAEPIRDAVYQSRDRLEGPRAFAEKREPSWAGE